MLHGPCGSRNGPDEVFGRHKAGRQGSERSFPWGHASCEPGEAVAWSVQRIADFSTNCFWTSPAGADYGHSQKRGFSYSGIPLRVDSKPSHSVYECSSADTQSDCSAIRTAYAALARAKRLYDFLALLPFVLLRAGVDIRS